MYKEIKIIYSGSIKDELINLFEKFEIDKYVNIDGLHTVWEKNTKRLNTHIWPGTDSMMFSIMENEKSIEFLKELRIIKQNLREGIELFVLVSPIDEII